MSVIFRALSFPLSSASLLWGLQSFKYPLVKDGFLYQKNDPGYQEACNALPGRRIKDEMADFLQAQNIRQDVIFDERHNMGVCAAAGTNMLKNGAAVIWIAPELYDTDKDACKFVLKHEISHIKNNDSFIIPLIKTICGIAAAIFAVVYISPFKGFVFCKSILFVLDTGLWQWRERQADNFAIQHATIEELRGGLRFFKAMKAACIECRNRNTIIRYNISNKGDGYLDLAHPSLESRIKKIEKALLERNEQLKDEDYSELTNVLVPAILTAFSLAR